MAAEPIDWLTDAALAGQLERPFDGSWSGVPLRDIVMSLSTVVTHPKRLAIMLDRRVDPGQKLDLKLHNVTLREAITQVARRCDLEVSVLGPVVYLGPQTTVERLRTLAELRRLEVLELPRGRQRAFVNARPWHWNDLTTPRELIAGLTEETGVAIRGHERVPHDLWPAADLPPLALSDRLTLLGSMFDLTFRIAPDGRSVELIPVEPAVVLERSYSLAQSRRGLTKQLASVVPEAAIRVENGQLIVRGRLEDHELVADLLQGKSVRRVERRRAGAPAGEKVFTLTVKQQRVGPFIRQLCKQLGLDARFDQAALDAAGVSLDTVVSFRVQQATLDELLRAALEPAGMTFSRQGRAVEIGPTPARP
jgi:hypothetical protein